MAEILVVEDYPPMASTLARLLRMRRHAVVREPTVAGAMQHSRCFDYAVLDIDLPDGNGVALAEHLRSLRSVPSILFFTATREAGVLSRARQLGVVVDKSEGVDKLIATFEHMQRHAVDTRGSNTNRVVTPSEVTPSCSQ